MGYGTKYQRRPRVLFFAIGIYPLESIEVKDCKQMLDDNHPIPSTIYNFLPSNGVQ